MGSTNRTTYYDLSQFISTDKPAWLQDYNGDMLKIDTGINAAKVAADAAALAAGTAQSTADGAVNSISTLSSTVSTHTSQITSLSGAINTINSLIGNGTPTTTDQTIIGAINEINANVGEIENHLTKQSINFTKPPVTGISVTNNTSAMKVGNIVTLAYEIDVAGSTSQYSTIITGMPAPDKTIYQRVPGAGADYANIAIDTSGNVMIYPSNNDTFIGVLTYISE